MVENLQEIKDGLNLFYFENDVKLPNGTIKLKIGNFIFEAITEMGMIKNLKKVV